MLMQNIHLDGLDDDVRIVSFGTLFRRIDDSKWGINIGFHPRQKKQSLSLSYAPILVRRRYLNPTVNHKSAGFAMKFRISNTRDWSMARVGDCPIFKEKRLAGPEARQLCFLFKELKGVTVYLPQLELARALFFHDGYLARTAMESDSLKAEFDVQCDPSRTAARINVLKTAGYPLKSLDDDAARKILIWILLDTEARKSYESIARYQKLNGEDTHNYRYWNFQFEPPNLPQVLFSVRGHYDKKLNSLFVYEIDAILNISRDFPEDVEIFHPRFREAVRGTGSGTVVPGSGMSSEHNIHDNIEPNEGNKHILLKAPVVKFEFAKAFKVTKVAEKKQTTRISFEDEDPSASSAAKDVSVEEATVAGSLPQAEWDIASDVTDDAHLYANKFDCFQEMLDLLVREHDCIVQSKQIRKLPQISRYKKSLLINGNPRCLAIVALVAAGKLFHLVEVDTSDAVNALSTQLLVLQTPENWGSQLEHLEQELVKKSLHWPTKTLRQICGAEGYRGIPHPKSHSANKGALEPGSVNRWADRFYRWIESML